MGKLGVIVFCLGLGVSAFADCESALTNVINVSFRARLIFQSESVVYKRRVIPLNPRQLKALKLLASEPGRIFSHEEIWDAVMDGLPPSKGMYNIEAEMSDALAAGIDRAFGHEVIWVGLLTEPNRSQWEYGFTWEPSGS